MFAQDNTSRSEIPSQDHARNANRDDAANVSTENSPSALPAVNVERSTVIIFQWLFK